MEEFFNSIIGYLLPKDNTFLYIFLFLSSVVENLFPPIPGDTITAFGAFLVGTGRLSYGLVYAATTAGSVTGFMALFILGKALGKKFFIEKNFKAFSAESIVSAEKWFEKYGYFVVLANRFLPGIRSVISIVSGISRLGNLKVLALCLLSASLWNFLWIHVGFLLGNNWEVVKERIEVIFRNYNIGVGIALVLGATAFFLVKRYRKKKGTRGGDEGV